MEMLLLSLYLVQSNQEKIAEKCYFRKIGCIKYNGGALVGCFTDKTLQKIQSSYSTYIEKNLYTNARALCRGLIVFPYYSVATDWSACMLTGEIRMKFSSRLFSKPAILAAASD
jgi:hypothetical protein